MPMIYKRHIRNTYRMGGFTLIELIVAVGLFSLVMLMASGAYLTMLGLNHRAQGMATGIDNLSFALETIARNIRTGRSYGCPAGCTGGNALSFINDTGQTVVYRLSGTAIQQQIGSGGYVSLTDPSVQVTKLAFYVTGISSQDAYQPHVTIVAAGTVSYGSGANKTESFSVETGATMRSPDI